MFVLTFIPPKSEKSVLGPLSAFVRGMQHTGEAQNSNKDQYFGEMQNKYLRAGRVTFYLLVDYHEHHTEDTAKEENNTEMFCEILVCFLCVQPSYRFSSTVCFYCVVFALPSS